MASVSFFASRINDESKKPLDILRALPTRAWNVETKRFYHDIVNDTVALTGMRFFHLTRKLILSVSMKWDWHARSTCEIDMWDQRLCRLLNWLRRETMLLTHSKIDYCFRWPQQLLHMSSFFYNSIFRNQRKKVALLVVLTNQWNKHDEINNAEPILLIKIIVSNLNFR